MNGRPATSRERTRHAILEAVADVILDTNGLVFSVQAVADRAGVTHRTVYNHFPTRDALCEAFSDYVEDSLSAVGEPLDPLLAPGTLPQAAERLYRMLQLQERNVRAGVMLMIGNRRPTQVWRERTHTLEQIIAGAAGTGAPPPRQVAAAVRLFLSSIGWHLLTEQCGLSTDEAAATGAWASRALLEAAAAAGPAPAPRQAKDGTRAIRRRRR